MFRSADHALNWAYRQIRRDVVNISSVYQLREPDPRSESELTPFERHGQAARILAHVAQLDDLSRGYITVKYQIRYAAWKRDPKTGRMVADWLPGDDDEWAALTRWAIAGFPTGVHSVRGARSLMLKALGGKVSVYRVARDLRVRTEAVPEYLKRIRERLESLHAISVDEITRALIDAGIVRDYDRG